MQITILSRSASIPSTKRLVEAARARGHRARVLNPVKVEMHLDGKSVSLFYRQAKLGPSDVVIPRIAQSITNYGLAVVTQFEMLRIPIMNTAQAISQARNKMRSLQLLSSAGIDIPATVMARDARDLKEMVKLVGGLPVLVKLLQGAERHGMMVFESLESLEAALEAILGLGHNLIVQQYVRKTGQDVRVFVVGNRAIAAVRRRMPAGRLVRTLIRGGKLESTTLTPAQQRAAVETTRLMGLEVAAVDLLDVKGSPKVFEVNSSPALPPMEKATGINLADAIIARAEEIVRKGQRQASPQRALFALAKGPLPPKARAALK